MQPVSARCLVSQAAHGRDRCTALHHPQDLHHRDVARRGWRKTADAVELLPHAAHRFARPGQVAGQVGLAQRAGVRGMAAHTAHHVSGHRPRHQRGAAARCDAAQHLGQRRVAHHGAHRMRLTVGGVEVGPRLGIVAQCRFGLQLRVQPGAHPEPLLGQQDRGLEQRRPRKLAVLAVRRLEHAHGARHPDRAAAHHGFTKSHRLAIGLQEEPLGGRGRRRLAAVPGGQGTAVPVQQESTAADAARLRLDKAQHHLHGDRRVERIAAGFERLVTGVSGQRVRRGDHESLRRPAGLLDVARGPFRQLRDRVGEAWRGGRRGRL